MSLKDKIANATETKWVTNGLDKNEVKAIAELALISAEIELSRQKMGMTQSEFAKYMGVSQGMVSKWESREYNFTVKSLYDIFSKLNIECCFEMKPASERKEYEIEKWQKETTGKYKKFRNMDWEVLEGAIA